ncbi:hypothetical protein BDR07DRAFT_485183 [Suillus spraguei]|nr:hypothetical protein BDR07DRAFT_485183 [Suillus spraguei]
MRIYTLISINYLLVQMIQSTSHPSSYGSSVSSAIQTHPATPLYAPVMPSSSVNPGVVHDSISTQNGCHLSVVADAKRIEMDAGGANSDLDFKPVLDQYGRYDATYMYSKDGMVIRPWSVGQKRVAEDLEDCDSKRIKMDTGRTNNDLYFKPVLDRYGRYSQDGMVIRPGRHIYHPKTAKYLGCGLVLFKCPLCLETYIQGDACERHCDDGCGRLATKGAPLSHSAAYQGSMSSASPVGVPTTAFTFSVPTTATTTSNSSSPETMLTEAAEHAPNLILVRPMRYRTLLQ